MNKFEITFVVVMGIIMTIIGLVIRVAVLCFCVWLFLFIFDKMTGIDLIEKMKVVIQ